MENSEAVKSVLIADDSALALTLQSRRLSGAGYRVVTASDGIEAVQKAVRETPDLIILDITMPRMNGCQVCRWIKGEAAVAHIPVIILSATDNDSEESAYLCPGADAFLSKGVDAAELLRTVERLLAQTSVPAASPFERQPPTPEEILIRLCALLETDLAAAHRE